MKKFQLWPWLALAGGCGAFLLRWAQLRLGFEADTGLPVPGDPWGVVLPLLLAALAILFLALSRGAPAGVTAEASLGRAFPVESLACLHTLTTCSGITYHGSRVGTMARSAMLSSRVGSSTNFATKSL